MCHCHWRSGVVGAPQKRSHEVDAPEVGGPRWSKIVIRGGVDADAVVGANGEGIALARGDVIVEGRAVSGRRPLPL